MSDTRFGLYVHIPFCRQLCPYCDFAVAVRRDPPHDAYCDALLAELAARSDEITGPPTTVYLGGGTPGMWATDALQRFVRAIDLSEAVEVTIEANPHDISTHRLDTWAEVGINRISLGVQSFDDAALAGLGRDHDGALALEAVRQIVADSRFRSSIDLIYGGPAHGPSIVAADLDRVELLGPDHVSAYQLTIETDTVFGRRQRAGTLAARSEDEAIDDGWALVEGLARRGFDRYEVSSYGRADDRAVHNSSYWLGRPYVGLGVGAHSFAPRGAGARRRRNVRSLKTYLAAPRQPAEVEDVSPHDHLAERLFLAARTTVGVSTAELRASFGADVDAATWSNVRRVHEELARIGWLETDSEEVRATARGLDFADAMADRFWDATRTS